jgi:transketolase
MLKDYLNKDIFSEELIKKAPRDGFGEGLLSAGENDERVVVLTADLMASLGKIPFATSYAVFNPGRSWEQIKVAVGINNMPVQVVGGHCGFSAGPYGSTHQALEDLSLIRVLPNMRVISPCDFEETKKAVIAMANNPKPTYLRFEKFETPVITTSETPFEIGKGLTLWESRNPQVAIIATGPICYEALLAAKELDSRGIESLVINMHTVKPIDEEIILKAARVAGCIVTVEVHQVSGGLGSAVSDVLSQIQPVPLEIIGVPDKFGESGKPEELLNKYGINKEGIVERVKKVILRRTS